MKFIVEQAVTGTIQSRDLLVSDTTVVRALSGPSTIEFTIEPEAATGINFKASGQLIHAETKRQSGERWILASGITQPAQVDPDTGLMKVTANGFSSYLDKMPWLDNWNPIAIDPFHVVHRIWDHVQSYDTGDLGVTVSPADSGTLLLPGFYYDGSEFILDFFAYFVRASDYRDCLEEVTSLCRDIPIDYLEKSEWNSNRTVINKTFELAYPRRGVQQNALVFRLGENVLAAEPTTEQEIDWTSDVIVRGWWPGQMHSSSFINRDPTRFRRVVRDEDVLINSRERAEVWAKRKLTRRQVPQHWGAITVDMYHPSAPWGTYDVGDDILISGMMPFYGKMEAWHRILTMQVDDHVGQVMMTTRHVDAFNYDPIDFE